MTNEELLSELGHLLVLLKSAAEGRVEPYEARWVRVMREVCDRLDAEILPSFCTCEECMREYDF